MSEQHEQAGEQVSRPHMFTLSEAAAACGVSRSRIRRLLDAGAFPNAVQEDEPGKGVSARVWHIPAHDLLGAGLMPNRPRPMPADSSGQAAGQAEQDAGQALAALQAELDLERERRRSAEAIAAERGRALDALEQALRLLEATNPQAKRATGSPTHSQGLEGGSETPEGEGAGGSPEGPQTAAGEPDSWWSRMRARLR